MDTKTSKIEARDIRRGDRVLRPAPADDGPRIREVAGVSAHLGGRELLIGFEDGGGLIVRHGHRLEVEREDRARVAPDAEEIGAGDEVVILDGEGGIAHEGVLRDVEDGTARGAGRPLLDPGVARVGRTP